MVANIQSDQAGPADDDEMTVISVPAMSTEVRRGVKAMAALVGVVMSLGRRGVSEKFTVFAPSSRAP